MIIFKEILRQVGSKDVIFWRDIFEALVNTDNWFIYKNRWWYILDLELNVNGNSDIAINIEEAIMGVDFQVLGWRNAQQIYENYQGDGARFSVNNPLEIKY